MLRTFGLAEEPAALTHVKQFDIPHLEKKIKECAAEMRLAAKELRFEDAARARDLMRYYQTLEMAQSDGT